MAPGRRVSTKSAQVSSAFVQNLEATLNVPAAAEASLFWVLTGQGLKELTLVTQGYKEEKTMLFETKLSELFVLILWLLYFDADAPKMQYLTVPNS